MSTGSLHPTAPNEVRGGAPAIAAVLLATLAAATVSMAQTTSALLSIHVAEPGVYAVPFEAMAPLAVNSPDGRRGVDSASLKLAFRGHDLPIWVDDGGDGWLDPGERLLFIASNDRLWPPSLHNETPAAVLQLRVDDSRAFKGPRVEIEAALQDVVAGPALLGHAEARRRLRFEDDRFRLPATRDAPLDGLESLWLWTTLSAGSSAIHGIDLGPLDDRARSRPLDLVIRASVVGWSNPEVPVPETQHQVDVKLGDRLIGSARWDGRRTHEIHFDGLPRDILEGPDRRLTFTVPPRPGVDGDPIIDLVHLDWVEVEYSVDRGLSHGSSPLPLPASDGLRWLPGDAEAADARLLAEAGWSATFEDGGWRLPPTGATEIWIVGDAELRRPLAVIPTSPAPASKAELDYWIIAPGHFLEGASTLAAIHERRGLAVDVVDARAVFDAYHWGRESTDAIRAFLDEQLTRSPGLRYVLLVGDADWLPAPEAPGVGNVSSGASWRFEDFLGLRGARTATFTRV